MSSLTFDRWLVMLLTVIAAETSGCGRGDGLKLAPVEGVVTLDGQPLPGARVEFNPKELAALPKKGEPVGGGSFAFTDDSGRYILRFDNQRNGAVPGVHSVKVATAGYAEVPDGARPEPEKVPPKYNLRSQLSFEVREGTNTIDLKLTSK